MTITIRVLGLELFSLTVEADGAEAEEVDGADLSGGVTASTPISFAPPWGDQRWEPGQQP